MDKNGSLETHDTNERQTSYEVKPYAKRWLVLFIFMYYASINAIEWIEYCSITPLVIKYYGVSSLAVDWTSIIFMAFYPPLVIPASMIIDKTGLRLTGLIGCLGTLMGTSIKVLSISNDLFFVVLIGQAIVAASQLVIVCLPPKIATVWFKPSEVSTACSLGVFGSQMGNALGFILPPLIVQDSDNVDEIGQGLKILCWTLTAACIPVTIALLIYFPRQPKLPPSLAQAQLRQLQEAFDVKKFFNSIKKLFTNKGFVIHFIAYGVNVGTFQAIATLLVQFILAYFEDANEHAGMMGFVMVIAGMVAIVIFGLLLDKTHKFKEITLFIYLSTALSIIGLMYALEFRSLIATYTMCAIVGIFTNAYMSVGFELGLELTFPSEESTTTGILISITMLLGAVFTVALGYLNLWFGVYWSLASQVVLFLFGSVLTACVPNNLLRQEAFNKAKNQIQLIKAL